MQIIELAVVNFKRFISERLEFCPGLNLLWGPNESGKSTIHEAICCALFGRERGKAVENWNGGSSSAELTYRSNGCTYRIERKLTEGTSRLGVLSGRDLTDVLTGKDEVAKTIGDHLGISSRSVFENTISVKQMNLSELEDRDLEAVGGEIQRVLTGTAHISADEVRKQLSDRRDAIRGKARPTNPREYDRVTERLTTLAGELADARNSRTQIQKLEEEQAELGARVARDSERLAVLEALRERHARWSQLTGREAELGELHGRCFDTLRDIKETIADLGLVQKDLEGYTELIGKDEEIAVNLTKIAGKREELDARLKELDTAERKTGSAAWRRAWIAFLIAAIALGLAGVAAWFTLGARMALIFAPFSVASAVVAAATRYLRGRAGGSAAELAERFRADLDDLITEEESILTYMKCQDIGRAWAKIRNYQTAVSRTRELEATLKGLLAGRKQEDWEAQEADLARELSGIRRELADDFKGYAPSTEESESWRSEHVALQNSLPTDLGRLHEVRGSLESERRNARDLAALEGELEFLHRRKTELEFVHRAYGEAISAIEAVVERVSAEYLPELSEQASAYLRRLTSGRYCSVVVQPGWEITVDCCDKTGVATSSLSIGTLDQLYFSLRLGCGELLSAGRKLPIVLDDPFPTFDRRRLDNALGLLKSVTKENQVLLMTHDPYILEWARQQASSGDLPCTIHELAAPGGQN